MWEYYLQEERTVFLPGVRMSICSLDEDSFHIATWRLLCENIDIWSSHASKKDLKNFFSNLIKFSFVQKRSCNEESRDCQDSYREITLHTISVELLCDTIIYDQKVLLSYSFHPKKTLLKNLPCMLIVLILFRWRWSVCFAVLSLSSFFRLFFPIWSNLERMYYFTGAIKEFGIMFLRCSQEINIFFYDQSWWR